MKNIFLLRSFEKSRLYITIASAGLLSMAATGAYADDHDKKSVDIMPVIQASDNPEGTLPAAATHETLQITPDKSELIRLDHKIGSVIVGNPLHISVLAESSQTLIVVPKSPGATHFTVLGKNGEVLMQRHVIVASPKENYLRVKKVCMEDQENCQPTNVYYCPDMCHEIAGQPLDGSGGSDSSDSQDNSGQAGNQPPPGGGGDIPDE
ncbi:MAG: pilus assembly protein N-terminal domain-containing protein [Alcanivorax sp.]